MNSFRTIAMKTALMISVLSVSTVLAADPNGVFAKFQEALKQNREKNYGVAIDLCGEIIASKDVPPSMRRALIIFWGRIIWR